MQINRLRLCNFRQHESTDLEFGPGLTGIIGPNGAGKTTLLEAIAWAMYGMPAARGSRETLRRRGAPPKAKVEVEIDFTLGPHEYRIVRADGTVRWLVNRARREPWHGRTMLFGVTIDITERRLAEQALRSADQRAANAVLAENAVRQLIAVSPDFQTC